ncbi:MAG: prolyl oligopeptidase family serine peptidase [Planctomycetota bacterium]
MKKIHSLATAVLLGCAACSSSSDGDDGAALTVSIDAPSTGQETDRLTLNAEVSGGTATAFAWRQVSGPVAGLGNVDGETLDADLPLVPMASEAVFEVTVTASGGAIATAVHSVSVGTTLGSVETTTTHDGELRAYTVYTPSSAPLGAPVVLFLHGAGGGMRDLGSGGDRWYALADDAGFVLVLPNGFNPTTMDGLGDGQRWNNVLGTSDVDDVGFVQRVVDEVVAGRAVDPDFIFAAGRSSGGMMVLRLLLEDPDTFRGGAALLSTMPTADPALPAPGTVPPLFLMNGTDDPIIPFSGGTSLGTPVRSTADVVTLFVDLIGAQAPASSTVTLSDVDPTDGCTVVRNQFDLIGTTDPGLVFYTVQGGGHNCPDPGADPGTGQCRDVHGMDLALDFFEEL